MHVIDAGGHAGDMEPGEQFVRFQCRKCEAETDWESVPSITAARRGIPCHNCNNKEAKDGDGVRDGVLEEAALSSLDSSKL